MSKKTTRCAGTQSIAKIETRRIDAQTAQVHKVLATD